MLHESVRVGDKLFPGLAGGGEVNSLVMDDREHLGLGLLGGGKNGCGVGQELEGVRGEGINCMK